MNAIRVNKVVIVAVLLGMTIRCLAVEGTWTRKSDLPTARLGLSTSVVNGKIYAIGGGYSIEGPHSRIVEEYDPVTDTWTKKADMPTGRIGHAASVVNGKVYVIGGDVRREVSGSEVEEYDPATDTWTRKADVPTKRTFLCACTMDGKIYAIGGIAAPAMRTLSTMEVYDPMTDTWSTKADMPTARCVLSACAVNGQIYVVGGSGNGTLRTVEEYDPATNTWTRKADMPTARASLCTSVVNGRIYVIGGASGMAGPVLRSVEEYDPIMDIWTTKADMLTPRWFFSTSAVGGKIYAIAGSTGYPPHSSISGVEEYDLTPPPPDFNGDGTVDGRDVLILTEHWGQDDAICDIAPPPFGDGLVDLQDLIILADYIGKDVSDTTLIAHWKFDETEGPIAYDGAGQNDATVIGAPAWQPAGGVVDGALELDGTTFVVADFVLSPAEGPLSIIAWVRGGEPGQAIMSQQAGADWLMLDPGVGFTWDGSTRSLYVDDVLVAEGADVALADCTGGMNIACGKTMAPTTVFSGLIDDVRIYNRAVKP